MVKVSILSGGAAAGVVKGIQNQFESKWSCTVDATFSAVGAMRELLLSGSPCDLVILTKSMIDGLIASNYVVAGSCESLGIVRTGVAVKTGEKHPSISTKDGLRKALLEANGIYFPDPELATAGIHVFNVLKDLGLEFEKKSCFRTYPNGATAMAAMANSSEGRLIGSTQVTEINITSGIELVGLLPREYELATDYCLGISINAKEPDLARNFAKLLTGPDSLGLRKKIGFEDF